MKPQYTLIVRDNDKNAVLFQFDVSSHTFTYNSDGRVKVEAEGFLIEKEETKVKVYKLDEHEEICGHIWNVYQGLEELSYFCKHCGIKK